LHDRPNDGDPGLLLRGPGGLLELEHGELDHAERVADVVTHNSEDPFLEVAGERELLAGVLFLGFLRLTRSKAIPEKPDAIEKRKKRREEIMARQKEEMRKQRAQEYDASGE